MAAAAESSYIMSAKPTKPIEVDDEDSIDEEQLEEYREEVEQLGSFSDKVKINSLSIIAGDHADSKSSAAAIYRIIRERLLSTSRDNMLPLVYVLDSILKNVKGFYIDMVQEDAAEWMPKVYQKLQDAQRAKLKYVWETWDNFNLFSSDAWKNMGRCFDNQTSGKGLVGTSLSTVAGIARTNDGSLILPASLRSEMQSILDELQKDETDELKKVSLERLADMDPDLLGKIKNAAEDNLRSSGNAGAHSQKSDDRRSSLPEFFTEIRSQNTLAVAEAWEDFKWDQLKETHDIISKLQHVVREGTSQNSQERYTQAEALDMTQFYAAASATSSLLTAALEELKNQEDRKNQKELSFPDAEHRMGHAVPGGSFLVDKSSFTNDGIKQKNTSIIGLLYEMGLPFLSSADGRRFRTEVELSKHLDSLFRKNQLDKAMTRTEERNWYTADSIWTGEVEDVEKDATDTEGPNEAVETDEYDPVRSTVPADETRDRCVICGINFKMIFDNDDGIYMYTNCREIEVLNDEAAENESEQLLVHVTCWRGLGTPEVLTMDQALQDTLRHQ